MVLEQFEALPAALRSQPRWVLWGLPGKAAKRPYCCISGGPASVTEAKTWTDFDEALTGAELWEAKGLGFVLGEGIACVDFDHCFNDDGQLDDWAAGWVERLDSYTERSQSGQGLHVFVHGALPAAVKSQKAELYSAGRYIAMTGDVFGGRREISDAQDALDALAQELRPAGARADVPAEVGRHGTTKRARSAFVRRWRPSPPCANYGSAPSITATRAARIWRWQKSCTALCALAPPGTLWTL